MAPAASRPAYEPSAASQVAGSNLLFEALAAEVITALQRAGCTPILLKGPATARWLYGPGERRYADIDILLRAEDMEVGHRTLAGLGFSSDRWPDSLSDRPFRRTLRRDAVEVDVHGTLGGLEMVDARRLWDELSARTEMLRVAGTDVKILDEGARALHIALHPLDHEHLGGAVPRADLDRALEVLPRSVWDEAAALARALDAEPQFAAGLRQTPEGALLADEMELSRDVPYWLALRRKGWGTDASLALGVDWWLRATPRTKLRIAITKLFPRPAYLRARSHLARLGPVGVTAAYVVRPFVLITRALRGLVVHARANWKGGSTS